MTSQPLVSIGLFVFNGERFIRKALDSILGQTFTDFELIISDNASTDTTGEICREYASRDPRIRYCCNERNMGAGWNIRRVFDLATGKYFKWAANDDMIAPRFLELCVEAMETDPSIVVSHSLTRVIDQNGEFIENYHWPLRTEVSDVVLRWRDLLLNDHMCYQIFGVMRTDSLRQVPPQGSYVNSDGVLLAQMGLLGRYYEIPDYLFTSTRHQGQSSQTLPSRLKQPRFSLTSRHGTLPAPEWWDPTKTRHVGFPEWRQLKEYTTSVFRPSLKAFDRLRCLFLMAPWIRRHGRRMMKDLLIAADQMLYNLQVPKATAAELKAMKEKSA